LLLLFVVRIPVFLNAPLGDVLLSLLYHAVTLMVLMAVTMRTRTVGLRSVGFMYLGGVFLSLWLSVLLSAPVAAVAGIGSSSFTAAIWVPIVEEVAKGLPVAGWFVLLTRRGLAGAASDGAVLGFAAGAGFTLHEDGLSGDPFVSGGGFLDAVPWSVALPTIGDAGSSLALNHGLWSALVGLGIGLFFLVRHRRGSWVFPAVAAALAILNHVALNAIAGDPFLGTGRGGGASGWAEVVLLVTVGGLVPLLALIAGLAGAGIFEWRILRWGSAREPAFKPVPAARVLAERSNLGRVLELRTYERLRRRAFYAAWRAERTGDVPRHAGLVVGELIALGERSGFVAIPAASRHRDASAGST
jgi:RsiW-degrading membrane proteinase PrsW (M82 family)